MVTERDRYEVDVTAALKELAKVYGSWRAIKEILIDSVRAYAEQEEADLRLTQALRLTGQELDKNGEMLKRQARAIQTLSHTISDDYVEALQAQALALGVSAAGVDDVVRAALGMNKALGIDAEQAVRAFAAAAQGESVHIKGLKEEIAGGSESVRIFRERYEGFLEATDSHKAGINEVKTEWGELQKEIGKAAQGLLDYFVNMKQLAGFLRTVRQFGPGQALEDLARGVDFAARPGATSPGPEPPHIPTIPTVHLNADEDRKEREALQRRLDAMQEFADRQLQIALSDDAADQAMLEAKEDRFQDYLERLQELRENALETAHQADLHRAEEYAAAVSEATQIEVTNQTEAANQINAARAAARKADAAETKAAYATLQGVATSAYSGIAHAIVNAARSGDDVIKAIGNQLLAMAIEWGIMAPVAFFNPAMGGPAGAAAYAGGAAAAAVAGAAMGGTLSAGGAAGAGAGHGGGFSMDRPRNPESAGGSFGGEHMTTTIIYLQGGYVATENEFLSTLARAQRTNGLGLRRGIGPREAF